MLPQRMAGIQAVAARSPRAAAEARRRRSKRRVADVDDRRAAEVAQIAAGKLVDPRARSGLRVTAARLGMPVCAGWRLQTMKMPMPVSTWTGGADLADGQVAADRPSTRRADRRRSTEPRSMRARGHDSPPMLVHIVAVLDNACAQSLHLRAWPRRSVPWAVSRRRQGRSASGRRRCRRDRPWPHRLPDVAQLQDDSSRPCCGSARHTGRASC